MMAKIIDKIEDWWYVITDIDWMSVFIVLLTIFAVGLIILAIVAGIIESGILYDEVENYDFTAQVFDKSHYTTTTVTYMKSGKTSIPVYHTHHHYKIMWEDGNERGELEIGENHYNLIKIGDFVNIHCSVREDKQGELHYYYTYREY